jgi:hypothetical protein
MHQSRLIWLSAKALCPTMRARGRLDSHRQNGFFRSFGFCPFRERISSRQPPVTQTVETVEKPFTRKNREKISHFRLKNDQNYAW